MQETIPDSSVPAPTNRDGDSTPLEPLEPPQGVEPGTKAFRDWYREAAKEPANVARIALWYAKRVGKTAPKAKPAIPSTLAGRAELLKITLAQLSSAAATCESCPHRTREAQLGTYCTQQGCRPCNSFVRFDTACPIGKWDNKPASVGK